MNTQPHEQVNALLERLERRVLEIPYARVLSTSYELGDEKELVLLHGAKLWILTDTSGKEQRLPWRDAPFRLRVELLEHTSTFLRHVQQESGEFGSRFAAALAEAEKAIES